jgi:alginate O-acetyltransferase complex protein AlgI
MITMLLGGLWHGASWMFVAWGALHGFYLWFERFLRRLLARFPIGNSAPMRALAVAATFVAVTVAWVPFRAPDVDATRRMAAAMAGLHGFGHVLVNKLDIAIVCLVLGGIVAAQNLYRDLSLEEAVNRLPGAVVTGALTAIFLLIAIMTGEDRSFIYFQF